VSSVHRVLFVRILMCAKYRGWIRQWKRESGLYIAGRIQFKHFVTKLDL